jgi:hypothetical protein
MIPKTSLRNALADPELLGHALAGETWAAWKALLLATVGEELTPDEIAIFTRHTGRSAPPTAPVNEAAFIIGRRGGKDRAVATLVAYLSALCTYSGIAPGEKPVVLCLGADQRQAKVQLEYIGATFETSPMLAPLVTNRTADTIALSTGISIESRAASFRRLRGITAVAVVASEVAFWMNEDTSANPDSEILGALRPALITTSGLLCLISSPYARRGELWNMYRANFGPDGDPSVLVAQGTSLDFNPTLPRAVIDKALANDRAAAAAEYLGEFRSDIGNFIDRAVLNRCVAVGVVERPPQSGHRYVAHADPPGVRDRTRSQWPSHMRRVRTSSLTQSGKRARRSVPKRSCLTMLPCSSATTSMRSGLIAMQRNGRLRRFVVTELPSRIRT